MALRTLVKVSEVNNLSDARYCAGMGVEMIGYSLDENHPKFIEISSLREISTWISGVKAVGEFAGDNIYNMNYLAEQLKLEYIQLNQTLHPEFLAGLKFPIIQKLNFTGNVEEFQYLINKYKGKVTYFLIESENLNSVIGYEKILRDICTSEKVILSFGISKENLDIILNEIKPEGIGLKGGHEIKPGFKEFDELAEILEELEIID
ncbi:MAG: hypothetical protein ACK40G_11105 [Cytophagaceae bacterium]